MSRVETVNEAAIDWSKCTWEGARLEQLRAFRQLSLRDKLQAVEEMCDVIRKLDAARRNRIRHHSQESGPRDAHSPRE